MMVARCIICTAEKPVVDEEAVDNRRYGPCRSARCVQLRALPSSEGPLFNTARLASDRENNTTQHEMHREAIAIAKAEGREDQIGMRR